MQQKRGAGGGRLEAITLQRGASEAGSLTKVRAVRDADDGEAIEAHSASQVFEEGQRIAARDGELHRSHPGQRFEAIQISVIQDARIPQDCDVDITAIEPPPLLRPKRGSVIQIAGLEAEGTHAPCRRRW
jgi:hypothetical protein